MSKLTYESVIEKINDQLGANVATVDMSVTIKVFVDVLNELQSDEDPTLIDKYKAEVISLIQEFPVKQTITEEYGIDKEELLELINNIDMDEL